MPLFQSEAAFCSEERACPVLDPCPRCEAAKVLTAEDRLLLEFYRRVADQWINQTPFGVKEGKPVLTPRLEGLEAALRAYDYPKEQWSWLVDGARLLHSLVHGQEPMIWPKPYHEITPEDVAENDAS